MSAAEELGRSENAAGYLARAAAETPEAIAVHLARGGSISCGALHERTGRLAAGLRRLGVAPGDRVLLMVRPSIDFVAAAYAVMRLGATAVFIDPGLGRRHLLACAAEVKPRALVAVRLLHLLRALRPRALASVAISVSDGRWPGAVPLASLRGDPPLYDDVPRDAADPAIISFTTGSTGAPKGVVLPHGVLHAQVRAFRELTRVERGDVVLAILPVMLLLAPGLGCPVVLPELDASHPARVDAAALARTIRRFGVTHSFGSPAVWRALVEAIESDAALTGALATMRCLMMGGAPIDPTLLARARALLGSGDAHTPYGATEAVPVTSATAEEILAEAARGPEGRGALVGRPLAGAEVRIVPLDDGPLAAGCPSVPRGEVGEIAVRGGVVSRGYFERPEADALARIPDAAGEWHRMGDVGRLDAEGRLWFCGRKAERVESEGQVMHTACVEPLLAHEGALRVALVGVGARPQQRAVLVVEPARRLGRSERRRVAEALLARAAALGLPIRDVLWRRTLPVDARHNAKVLRGELARWAATRLA